jgi:hypothetical protein
MSDCKKYIIIHGVEHELVKTQASRTGTGPTRCIYAPRVLNASVAPKPSPAPPARPAGMPKPSPGPPMSIGATAGPRKSPAPAPSRPSARASGVAASPAPPLPRRNMGAAAAAPPRAATPKPSAAPPPMVATRTTPAAASTSASRGHGSASPFTTTPVRRSNHKAVPVAATRMRSRSPRASTRKQKTPQVRNLAGRILTAKNANRYMVLRRLAEQREIIPIPKPRVVRIPKSPTAGSNDD